MSLSGEKGSQFSGEKKWYFLQFSMKKLKVKNREHGISGHGWVTKPYRSKRECWTAIIGN